MVLGIIINKTVTFIGMLYLGNTIISKFNYLYNTIFTYILKYEYLPIVSDT